MDLDTPKARELAATARRIAETVIAPDAERLDQEGAWPERAMQALAEAGLMGLHVPVSAGGHGLGMEALVVVARELAHESPSTALCYAMHCVGTAVLAAKATPEQTERYLIPIAQGRHVTTLALSEPGSGSEFWVPQTTVTTTDDGYLLDGTKSFVTNGFHADSYVVSVAAPAAFSGEEGSFSCVVLDRETERVEWGPAWEGFGMRSNSSRGFRMDGARVPRSNLLGEEGAQLWYIFEVVAPYFLTAMAATYLGVAEAALNLCREHLGSRRHAHTGELLGNQPVLAHELGGLWIQVESTRQLVLAATRRADAGDPDALLGVLGCKVAASDAAVELANSAMTLLGGIGYRDNGKAARLLRDARASHVMAPTTNTLQQWIGRALLQLPLL